MLATVFLTQILLAVTVIVAFGVVIDLCHKALYRLTGETGRKILLVTGVVGTPIHELSHAVMCLIFGHKITEIKLYQPSAPDGALGYVNHSYNPRNLYQQIGNFFIGVAPVLGGGAVILLLMRGLSPALFSEVEAQLRSIALLSDRILDLSVIIEYSRVLWDIILTIIVHTFHGGLRDWIFLILALMISNHIELSTADIKGGFFGFLFGAFALFVTDAILLSVSPEALGNLTAAMTSFTAGIVGFLTVSVIFSVLLVLAGALISGLMKVFRIKR